MPVPSTHEIRKPLLEAFRGEAPRNFATNELLELIANHFGRDVNEMSSGDKNLLRSEINEAKSYLRQKGLVSNPAGSTYMLTQLGRKILEENHDIIDDSIFARPKAPETIILPPVEPEPEPEPVTVPEPEPVPEEPEELPEHEPQEPELPEEIPEPEPEPEPEEPPAPEPEPDEHEEAGELPEEIYTPEEPEPAREPEPEPATEAEEEEEEEAEGFDYAVMPSQGIEDVLARYNSDLADEVLMKTAAIPSDMFEMLVIDLLSKMGYHAFQNARYANESSGGDFIQGVILEDKPGLSPVYVHARKLSPGRTVGKAEIKDFADALADKGGKGIFATTAGFSEQAVIAANDERIMLIDGTRLAGLMISHNFCVNVEKVFEVKAIDNESFSEYEA